MADEEQGSTETFGHIFDHPGFRGALEFDMSIEVLGKAVKRRARAEYEYTPEWEYFDLRHNAPFTAPQYWSMQVTVLTVPAEDNVFDVYDEEDAGAEAANDPEEEVDEKDDDDSPQWVDMNFMVSGVLSREIWDTVEAAIDAKCRLEDAERRRAAAH